MTVVTVKVSNSERTLKEKHLLDHQLLKMYKEDTSLNAFVSQAVENFNGEVDDVTVIINIPW